ncbi:MAG TPA: UDP-N-acetylmuramate dehydrogenase [Candidatus Paceibacterota bacterium]
MNKKFRTKVSLAPYTTFHLGGEAAHFTEVESAADMPALVDESRRLGLPIFPLGGGSNIIITDQPLARVVLKMCIPGIEVVPDSSETLLHIGAGVNWDDTVAFAVERGLVGIEALSAIPGTVGAAPVQNIGAYGAELADVLESVEVYDTQSSRHRTLGTTECQFSYRDSIFKHEKGRYIITAITLRLREGAPSVPRYPGVAERLATYGVTEPTAANIRTAITAIRWSKLPKPEETPNVGSFFKNPVIDSATLARLLAMAPAAPHFPTGKLVKMPAGWFIEQVGFKGASFGRVGTHDRNAIVLMNRGGATFADVVAARDRIAAAVREKFGVDLEMEPELVV